MPRHVYLQPGAPDPILPADVALALARRHAPDAAAVRAVEESGGEARAYLVDDDLILKTQRPPQLRPLTSLEKEVFFLRQLDALPSERRVSVPRVLGYGRAEPGIEYTLLTRMPGVAMRRATLHAEQRRAALFALGRTLRRIHALPVDPFIASGLVPGDLSFMDTQTRLGEQLLDRARELHDRRLPWSFPLTIEQVGARALAAMPRTNARVALHSNPYEEHAFVDPASGAFSGLIDFGDAYISHPALDMRRWNRPADRDALLAGYAAEAPVDDDFLTTWRAVMIVGVVNAIVQQPERAAEARDDLASLLAEL